MKVTHLICIILLFLGSIKARLSSEVWEEEMEDIEDLLAEGKIIGGKNATRGQFPFVVGLWRTNTRHPFCGGSLISNRFVLTAAHCVKRERLSSFKVVTGDLDLNTKEPEEHIWRVCKIKIHPYYSSHDVKNDIALLKLCLQVRLSYAVQPIALSERRNAVHAGDRTTVAGWGVLTEGGRLSSILKYVPVEVFSETECRRAYPWVTKNQICAGIKQGGKDSCQGDSGGPLWWIDPNSRIRRLVGIVSNGKGCARKSFPGVYTKVSAYFDWILETMASGL